MSDWERLGRYVVARRVKLGHRQRGTFADAVGVSARVLSDIENGRRGNFDAVTIAALEEALGWEIGSAAQIVDGGEPVLRSDASTDHPRRPASMPDEISLIYVSKSMTAQEKLDAIRKVLELRAEVEGQAEASLKFEASARGEVEPKNR